MPTHFLNSSFFTLHSSLLFCITKKVSSGLNYLLLIFIYILIPYFMFKLYVLRVTTLHYSSIPFSIVSTLKIFSLKGGDPAAPSDTATLLRLHPSHQFYLRQLPPIARLAHWLRVPPTPMAWRAVCTRPGNAFTPTFWFGITSNSVFVWAGFSPQSELGETFWGLLHIAISLLFVSPIVARV